MNLSLVLDMACSGHGDRTAVSAGEASLTYDGLDTAARALAAHLRDGGATALVHLGTNALSLPVGLFAAARAGVPFVPLNYRLAHEQLTALLADHAGALLLHEGSVPEGFAGAHMHRDDVLTLPVVDDAPEPPDDEELVAVLLYTSGTTAAPKAAILRHRHLMAYLLGTVEFGGAGADEAALVTVPPYHIAGVTNLVSNLYAGRRIVYLDGFEPRTWLDTVRRERITQAMVVPTMLARIVDVLGEASDAGTPTLRALSYGGARMPLPVLERALALFPQTGFVNAYGLTETSSTIALLGPDEHRAAFVARAGRLPEGAPPVRITVRRESATAVIDVDGGTPLVDPERWAGKARALGGSLTPSEGRLRLAVPLDLGTKANP
jgi:acyl-CoA synthetase (AMP-forming)/AMP-acid ligase II